jgi:16S rRNA (cytosine967-C5)-methyltransferase
MGEIEPGAARPPLSARALAARILERVIDEGAWSQKAIDGELRHFRGDRREGAFATLLVYGVLTWRESIDAALNRRLRSGLSSMPPRARHHFRVAAYQLGWLSARIPASAAVNEAVNLIRLETNAGLSGVANAVLRGLARDASTAFTPEQTGDLVVDLARRIAIPDWIAAELVEQLPPERCDAVGQHWNDPTPVHLRVRNGDVHTALLKLNEAGFEADIHAVVPGAVTLRGGSAMDAMNTWAEQLTIQDAGAQLAVLCLPPTLDGAVLDACAGLGVKSVQLHDRYPGSRLVCTDRNATKLRQLSALVEANAVVASWDIPDPTPAAVQQEAPFAVVLVDAPCSGLGTIGRHPEVRQNRKFADIQSLALVQRTLLDSVAPLVAPGGWLLYVVCTFTRAEGVEQVKSFLARHPDFCVDVPTVDTAEPGVDWSSLIDRDGCITLWPDRVAADTFTLCRLRRRSAP